MAICNWCDKDMSVRSTKTCAGNTTVEFPDGTTMPSIPFSSDYGNTRCHDCYIELGGFHHPGCDMERCPRCGGQLISCGCLDDPAEEETEEDW